MASGQTWRRKLEWCSRLVVWLQCVIEAAREWQVLQCKTVQHWFCCCILLVWLISTGFTQDARVSYVWFVIVAAFADDDGGGASAEDDAVNPATEGKVGTKKLAKLQAKADKKIQREVSALLFVIKLCYDFSFIHLYRRLVYVVFVSIYRILMHILLQHLSPVLICGYLNTFGNTAC